MQDADNRQDAKGQGAPSTSGETRPQQGGEAATTRFGMEDGDNTDTPATGLDPDMQSEPQG